MKAFRHASQHTFSTLNLSSFERIAGDVNVSDTGNAAKFLHKLGIIRYVDEVGLYIVIKFVVYVLSFERKCCFCVVVFFVFYFLTPFPSDDDIIVLDPQWILNMYTCLVKSKDSVVSNAILLEQHASLVWCPPEFPTKVISLFSF